VNEEWNAYFLIPFQVSFDGSSGFIEQLGGIDDSHYTFSNLSNNVNGKLCFGIHNNHPLRPLNNQKELFRESLIM
jgi:hypothetical protein